MYFLTQLQNQFFQTISLSVGEEGHALDDLATPLPANDNNAPENQEDFSQAEISAMSSSEILEELKERLEVVKAGEKIEGTAAEVFIRFCTKVKNNEVHGYTTEDEDYKRLVQMAHDTVVRYRSLQGEAIEIDREIKNELNRITLGINKEIDNPEENSIIEESSDGYEKLEGLKREKDSYEGIFNEELSNFSLEQRENFSDETKQAILAIEGISSEDIAQNITIQEQITNITDINQRLKDGVEGLSKSLEYEKSLFELNALLGGIRLAAANIGDERLGEENIAEIARLEAIEFTGTVQDKITEIKGEDGEYIKAEQLLKDIYALAELSPEEEGKLKGEREKYLEKLNNITARITPFQGQEGLTLTMKGVIEMHQNILDATPIHERTLGQGTEFEQLIFLEGEQEKPSLDELSRLTDIALRDEGVVGEDGEKLGNTRAKSTSAAYEKTLENSEVEEALKDEEGNIPTFEELRMDDIVALREAGVNLSELFLTDIEGNNISGEVEAGKSYIVNFGTNTHLSGKMDFAFLAMNTENIIVDGKELSFDNNSFEHEGEIYTMRDGSLIEISSNFEDSEGSETRGNRHEAIIDNMDGLGAAEITNDFIDRAMSSSNPAEAFEVELDSLPGGLVGWFMAMVLNFGDGRNFKYDPETKTFREVLEDESFGDSLSNGDVAGGALRQGSPEQINIDAGLESQPAGVRGLVSMIYEKESRGNANAVYGGYRGTRPDLTSMTIREVREFQDHMVASQGGGGSSAVGAPQIIRKTMDGAIRAGILDPNENFDAEAQNRFTLWKLEQRGLGAYMNGSITDLEFMKRLSMEWASFPKDMGGASYYAGDGLNSALIRPEQVLHQINRI